MNKIKRVFLLAVCLMIALPVRALAAQPSLSAQSAVLMAADTGKLLFTQNSQERLPMASTTKIMTALLALESGDLDAVFTVDPQAIQVEGSSMGLQKGDQVTMRVLAYGMLLQSGNDGANAAAVRIAGSTAAFAELMNQRAQEIGMLNTHFVTPSGLDDEQHYTTAEDMARLARVALQNPDFLEICSASTAKVSYGNPPYDRWMTNHNRLLREYSGCIGVKTGFTKKSGRCLVSAAERDGVRLIAVTLNAPSDWADHKALLDYGFSICSAVELPMPEEVTIPVVGGTTSQLKLRASQSVSIAVTAEELDQIEIKYFVPRFCYAPVEQGEVIGYAQYRLHGETLRSVPLEATQSVMAAEMPAERSVWDKVVDFFQNLWDQWHRS